MKALRKVDLVKDGNIENIVKFFFETGELKRIRRSGWWTAKVSHPESVAEHSHRTAIIAFVLAKCEGVDENKLCAAAVFHDVPECRLLDLHKIAQRYVTYDDLAVISEQLRLLPKNIKDSIRSLWHLSKNELDVLLDADCLEVAIQAKEYQEHGYADCADWISNAGKRLKTKSAKMLYQRMLRMRSNSWWQGLKKL